MESGFRVAWLPLKRYAAFHGRSTRFELLLFYVLIIVLRVTLGFATPVLPPESWRWIDLAFAALFACPVLALMTRRLHDTGRSGRWLLLGLPLLGLRLWEAWIQFGDPLTQSPIDALPVFARVTLALTGVALIVLLLWDDEEGANQYGPNPRYAPAEAAA